MAKKTIKLEIDPVTAEGLCTAIYYFSAAITKKSKEYELDNQMLDLLKISSEQAISLMELHDRIRPAGAESIYVKVTKALDGRQKLKPG